MRFIISLLKIVFHKITYPLKKIGRKDKLLLTCIFHFHLYIKRLILQKCYPKTILNLIYRYLYSHLFR